MNPIALYFASGESLYSGSFVLLLVLFLSPVVRGKWLVRLRNALAWIAFALILLACVPLSWLLYVLLFGAFITWFVVVNLARSKAIARIVSSIAAGVLVLAFVLPELFHRSLPSIAGSHHDHLVVIGDSISAGINAGPWPEVFTKQTGVPIKNLSSPGIGTDEAIGLAAKVTPDDTLILLEIGGNDLLANLPSDRFETQLQQLLSNIDRPGRTIVMFELPLLPHKIAYGSIQRKLAAEHHVILIPKRCFIAIIGPEDATTDGLHLSPSGAKHMATFVADLFTNILPPTHSTPIGKLAL